MIEADVFVEDAPSWRAVADWQNVVPAIVRATLLRTPYAVLTRNAALIDLSLRFADDKTVQALNRETRGQDKPTNVLSFQYLDSQALARLNALPAATLGDIVLAAGVVAREAAAQNKTVRAHATHLVVHGLLHLLGYDHQLETEAQVMEALERTILADLGIADPYADPSFHLPD